MMLRLYGMDTLNLPNTPYRPLAHARDNAYDTGTFNEYQYGL